MKFSRDPLFHFVVAGALLFGVHALYTAHITNKAETITVTGAELERMAALYTAEAGTLPSETDMAAMVNEYVRDQALSREARRLGLDTDDTIITRRLSQKMAFMVSDLAKTEDPGEDTLRAWHEDHPDRFTAPPRISFSHVYVSPDARGARASADAEQLLASLNGPDAPSWQSLGDPFMLQRSYGDLPLRETARLFGTEFATALTKIEPGTEWKGPLRSSLGLHLVQLTSRTDARLIPFDEARAQVLKDWRDENQRAANEDAIAQIIARYKVEIE